MNAPKHTPGEWKWWTSNSRKRLRSELPDGRSLDVLESYVCSDGVTDLIITDGDMALIKEAPALLALAHQYVSECGECRGSGVSDDTRQDCESCEDARAVIARATNSETTP